MPAIGKPLTRQLDLNLLELFTTVHQTRNLTVAGHRLGLSQPAMSYRLASLRRSYGDELFVRTRRGVEPTALADELAAPIAAALRIVRGTVERDAFDPARSTRVFRVAMNDIGERYFLPRLAGWLAVAAPRVSVQTLAPGVDELLDRMTAGEIDLAVGYLPALGKRMHQQALFVERFVYLMRRGHPAAKRPLGLPELRELRHVLASPPGTEHVNAIERVLASPRVRADICLRVQNFLSIGPIVAGSDLVSPVPSNLAALLAPSMNLTTCAPPVRFPEFEISGYWHPRVHQDPASLWLRQAFGTLFRKPASGSLPGAPGAARRPPARPG